MIGKTIKLVCNALVFLPINLLIFLPNLIKGLPEEYIRMMDEINDAKLLALAAERMEKYSLSKYREASQLPQKISISIHDRILTFSCYKIEIHLLLALGVKIRTICRNIAAHHRAVCRQNDSVTLI